jgi:hypothetical protein
VSEFFLGAFALSAFGQAISSALVVDAALNIHMIADGPQGPRIDRGALVELPARTVRRRRSSLVNGNYAGATTLDTEATGDYISSVEGFSSPTGASVGTGSAAGGWTVALPSPQPVVRLQVKRNKKATGRRFLNMFVLCVTSRGQNHTHMHVGKSGQLQRFAAIAGANGTPDRQVD